MALTFRPVEDARRGEATREDRDLCSRVEAEFHEMPGLMLTLPQAARLFSLEPDRCARVLSALVDAGRLSTDGLVFSRTDCGPSIRFTWTLE
jgi:hypothetical protein